MTSCVSEESTSVRSGAGWGSTPGPCAHVRVQQLLTHPSLPQSSLTQFPVPAEPCWDPTATERSPPHQSFALPVEISFPSLTASLWLADLDFSPQLFFAEL